MVVQRWKMHFLRRCSVKIVLFCTFAFVVVSAVDRSKFKSCDESSFCRRNRGMQPSQSPYELLMNTMKIYPTRLEAEIKNNDNQILFKMQVFALVDDTVRLKIDELNPLRPRFRANEALAGEPEQINLVVESRDALGLTFTFSKSKVVLNSKPFRLDLYSDGELVMSSNARGLMKFEHTREKAVQQEAAAPDENAEEPKIKPESDEPGMWEESFGGHSDSKHNGPQSVGMDFSFIGFEHVYGIPEHADSFSLKDTKTAGPYRLYNLDVFEYDIGNPMALYASIPYMIAHSVERTVGLLWLNAAETWIDISAGLEQNVMLTIVDFVKGQTRVPQKDTHWFSESGIIDVFFFLGPKSSDVFRQYSLVVGTTQLPPLFSLGYHQCRWNYVDQVDVQNVDAGFDEHDIPYDVIWLDIEYTDGKRYFTWDPVKFSHPRDMVNNLTAKGRKLIIIIDPHIKRAAGYFVHEDATAKGYYVKNKDGGDYEGWSWPGSASYLDFFNPVVRDYWASNYDLNKFEGTSLSVHIWNDMNEPSVFNGPEVTMPKDCVHHGGWEHRDVHNMYSLVQVMATHQGLIARGDGKERPFVLTRGAFVGTQRYAALWNGDNTANWDHLRITVPMLLSLSIAGMSFCGSDVGGFFGNPDSELFIRWYQAAAFHPFFRAHSHLDTRRREPWLMSDETTKLIRAAIRTRYSFIPYWYTLFYENEKTGLPPMRPLWLEFPEDSRIFAVDDEHMVGSAILVHPVTQPGAQHVDMFFPGKNEVWYDVNTYDKYDSTGSVNLPVTINKIPVFQRGGTVIPKKERVRRSSSLGPDDPYTLFVALNKEAFANGTLYIDDGSSYGYRQGEYLYTLLTFKDNVLTSRPSSEGLFKTKSWLERVVVMGISKKPTTVYVEVPGKNKKIIETSFDKKVLILRKPTVNMGESWTIILSY